MRILVPLLVLLLCPFTGHGAPPLPPDQALQPLFQQVQRAQLFSDQKTFADAVPQDSADAILARWQQQRDQPGFALHDFIEREFQLPPPPPPYTPAPGQRLRTHIEALWPVLSRRDDLQAAPGSLLPLPHPYVVPGGRFREVYYWDSYFTLLGLASSQRWQQVREMVDNFAWQIDTYGHIPNGNRSYYLSRSQPPFFSLMVELLAGHEGQATYQRYRPQLQAEHAFWMQGATQLAPGQAQARAVRMADGSLLSRYWDARAVPRTESWMDDLHTAAQVPQRVPSELFRDLRAGAESGWDFSSRWLDDPQQLGSIHTTAIIPVDLNSLLHHLETTLAHAAGVSGDRRAQRDYQQQADARRAAIATHLWSAQTGHFVDLDLRSGNPRPALTAAALFPLWLGIATQAQAEQTATAVRAQLLGSGGLLTTSVRTGQQWDAPNGWAPLQWVAVDGLQRYRLQPLAGQIGTRFLRTVQQVYAREGKLVEKYVVDGSARGGGGGEYPLQDGFGWSNGVVLALLDRLCAAGKRCEDVDDLPAEDVTQ